MSTHNNNIPALRFREFSGEWEEHKLGDVCTTYSGGTPLTSVRHYYNGDIPFIRSGEIHNASTEITITEEGLLNSSAKLVKKGDLLLAVYGGGTVGEIDISKIDGAINQAILCIRTSEDKNFLKSSWEKKVDYIVNHYVQGAQENLSAEIVKNVEMCMPTLAEQQELGNYFSALDVLLLKSSCRVEKLKQVKAACLQNMFPKKGHNIPNLRFKGFSLPWEEVRLGECLEISEERNTNNEFGKNDVLSVSEEDGVMNQIELLGRSYAGKSVLNYKVLRINQIVYTKSPLKAKPYGIIKVNKGEVGIVSVLYAVYNCKENISPEFIHYYFDPCFRINDYLRPLINKGAKNTMNITDETAIKGKIIIPPTLAEQQKIGDFFSTLDAKISLASARVEKLKQIKAACLRRMFP